MIRARHYRIAVAILFASLIVTQGQACSPQGLQSASLGSEAPGGGNDDDRPPVFSGKATDAYRIAHLREVLPSLASVLNFTPSQNMLNMMGTAGRNLSEDGADDSISAPQWNSIVTLAGNACSEMITKEKALPAAERTIFKELDFAKGPSAQSSNAIPSAIRTLARNGWLRNETDAERAMIIAEMATYKSNLAADTTAQALFLCSAMMASLDAHIR